MKKLMALTIAFIIVFSLAACRDSITTPPPSVNTGIAIEYDTNFLMNIYDIRISVNDSALGTQTQGEKKLYELSLPEGIHEIVFSEVGDNTNTTTKLVAVSEGEYYYFFIKTRNSGIEIEKQDTMTLDEAHSFLGESTSTDSLPISEPTLTPSKESEESSEPTPTTLTTSSDTGESAEDILPEENMTIDNNADLAALFANGEDTDLCQAFVEQYKGRTIEFDGCIAYMSLHGDYTTRYDILIYAGDYSEDSSNGSPAMQFFDVNITTDLHLTGNVPDYIGQGDNLHIIAEVEDIFNDYLILLEPISISAR